MAGALCQCHDIGNAIPAALLTPEVLRMKDFFRVVTVSDPNVVAWLRAQGVLPEAEDAAPCHKCNGEMCTYIVKKNGNRRVVLRCKQRGCQTTRSVREGNRFFHYIDRNGRVNSNLSISAILEIIYVFVQRTCLQTAVYWTNRSKSTLVDWYNMCREVCTEIIRPQAHGRPIRPKMVGTADNPIQIDESRFAGKRKYNRGRLLEGNLPAVERDDEVEFENLRNHGDRVDGPWVFGLKQGIDHRFYVVDRRDRATLDPIIRENCAPGSEIHSDEWAAYAHLSTIGFVHGTVNHQHNYVNPANGNHTQGIERSWLDCKTEIMKKMRGVPVHQLQGHLDFFCWRKLREGEPDLFLAFLRDMVALYRP